MRILVCITAARMLHTHELHTVEHVEIQHGPREGQFYDNA